ncbi:MAG: xanthine dehydrogenase family protein molybdopterin-binding subunit [Anaerolineae bacterium]
MTSQTSGYVGRPMKRIEDRRFLIGEARFVGDMVRPGMLHVVAVRSLFAHARITHIDVAAARSAPGVAAVVTARDIAGQLAPVPWRGMPDVDVTPIPHPILASDGVSYVGQAVAIVAAETLAQAQDAADLVVVDYDPLPVVSVARAAAGGPTIHPHVPDNVALHAHRGSGDVDAAFRQAAHVVRGQFHIPRLAAAPMETRGILADYNAADDLLTIWVSAQGPYGPRAQLAQALGRPEESIRAIVPDVGGAFGSKSTLPVESVVSAWLAVTLDRPVRWVEDRQANLMTTYQGRGLDADVETAVADDGRITGLRANLTVDLGAYLFGLPPMHVVNYITGAYAIPAADVNMVGVVTNKPPTGPYRGAGRPEAAFIIERTADLVARELGMDPAEVRRRNLIPPAQFPYRTAVGAVYDSGEYERCLDRALELLDYEQAREAQARARQEGRLVGIGLSLYIEQSGILWENANVAVAPDGSARVRISATSAGQGHDTVFAQIAADALGIAPESVTIESGDTAVMAQGIGTFASRTTVVAGGALVGALDKVKAKAAEIAGHLLEVAAEDIEWQDGRLNVRGAPDRGMAFQAVAAAAYQAASLPPGLSVGLEESAQFAPRGPAFGYGTYATIVEVSRDTGQLTIQRFVAVDDAGRIVNPLLAEGQVIGSLAQGLGEALTEEMVYDESGQLLTATFMDYGVLRAAQMPPIVTDFLETPSPLNPLGVKGIGEAGTIGGPPAIVNAVVDALAPLGVRSVDMPVTAEKLWRLISP